MPLNIDELSPYEKAVLDGFALCLMVPRVLIERDADGNSMDTISAWRDLVVMTFLATWQWHFIPLHICGAINLLFL